MNNSTLIIQDALKAAEISCEELETVKNGVKCTGYRIITSDPAISPVIYHSQDETVEAFVDRAKSLLDTPTPDINIQDILVRDYILKNTYVCVQKPSDENILRQRCMNFEIYYRIEVKCGTSLGSIKVNRSILDAAGVSEQELIVAARQNSLRETRFRPMAEILGMPDEMQDAIPLYVGTYSSSAHGAGILALPEAFHEFAVSHDVSKCIILPSSTEEIIVFSDDCPDYEQYVEMVRSINDTEVEDILQMEPAIYVYDDVTKTVEHAA